jgi:HSP20 family protein
MSAQDRYGSDDPERGERPHREPGETAGPRPGGPDEGDGSPGGPADGGSGQGPRRGDGGRDGPGSGGTGERRGEQREHRAWGDTLHDVQETVGEMVGEVLEGFRDIAAGGRFPRVDVVRVADDGYRVLVDLPGVEKDDLEVTTLGGEITVSGQRPHPELPEGSEVLRAERGHGRFRRSVRLPSDIREEDVRATLEDGVLVVRIGRARPDDAKRVEID